MSENLSEIDVVDGFEAGAEAAAATEAPPADVVEGSPSPEAPAAPAWTPDPDEWEALQTRLARFEQAAQQTQPAAVEQGEPTDWNEALNPLSDNYGANLVNLLQQRDEFILNQMRELNAPVLSRYEQESLAEGQQRIDDIIADDFSRNGAIEVPEEYVGKVDPSATIKQIAPAFMQQFEQRYGDPRKAAEASLAHAAGLVRSLFEAGAKAGEGRYTNRMATLSSANSEPGAGAGAIHAGPEAANEMAALEAFLARNAA